MSLQAAIEKSQRWLPQCASLIDGISFLTTDRARIAASLYHLSIEHYTGIHVLVKCDVIGSAFALFRSQFEAYVRGAWYQWCANETQVTDFLCDRTPPKLGTMIENLEKKDTYGGGSLTRMKNEVWPNLNGFTHGGMIQVRARSTGDEIVQSYKPEHTASLLVSSATLSLLAGVGIALVADNDVLANKLREAHMSVYDNVL